MKSVKFTLFTLCEPCAGPGVPCAALGGQKSVKNAKSKLKFALLTLSEPHAGPGEGAGLGEQKSAESAKNVNFQTCSHFSFFFF